MSGSIVVLNSTYEPISLTRLGRAVNLVMSGKAVIEEAIPDRFVRHSRGKLPLPKIIRMLQYIKIPFFYEEQPWSRNGVLRRDKHVCQYCGQKKSKMTIDHVTPRALGGGNTWENTVAACFPCNNKKGHKPLNRTNMTLLSRPRAPLRFEYALLLV